MLKPPFQVLMLLQMSLPNARSKTWCSDIAKAALVTMAETLAMQAERIL